MQSSLIERVLQKIRENRAEGVLMVPTWTNHSWYLMILRMMASPPHIIPKGRQTSETCNRNYYILGPDVSVVYDFLCDLYEDGGGYSALNTAPWSLVLSTILCLQFATSMRTLMKVAMLTLLSCANASVVVLTHYVRTRKGAMFSASTAVLMAELVKVCACLLVTFLRHPSKWLSSVYAITLGGLQEWARVAVPAALYAVQNNLVFFALSNLNSVVFQVTYQLKILTTALFSVVILRKTLSVTQWLSLLLLFAGVAVTQIKGDHSHHTPTAHAKESIGLASVIGASILSGFASIYFEKILKEGSRSVWERNIQLGIPGAVCATVTLFVKDGHSLVDQGFFHGYDSWVWILIVLQSLGGLLVAFVVKVMDNILKTFAMALAILLSSAAAFFLFHTGITIQTGIGAHLVIIAMFLYGYR